MFDLPPPRHISTLRILVVATRSGEGPFTIRFADLGHCSLQTGGLFNTRPTPWHRCNPHSASRGASKRSRGVPLCSRSGSFGSMDLRFRPRSGETIRRRFSSTSHVKRQNGFCRRWAAPGRTPRVPRRRTSAVDVAKIYDTVEQLNFCAPPARYRRNMTRY